jgi:hypothetical protein
MPCKVIYIKKIDLNNQSDSINFQEKKVKTGTYTPLFITKKIIIAIQIPYCHYFKASVIAL